MASKPRDLVVRFVSDVREFVKGTDKIDDALRDTARDLDRVAEAGEDSARDLARAYDRAADKIKRDTRDATRNVKADVADTGKEAGAEFASNMGEAISSGDWSSVANDTAGGLSAALLTAGPVGAVAGAAVALGGIFLARFQADAAKVKALAAATFDAYRDGLLEQAEKEDLLTQLLGAESYDEALRKLGRLAREAGEDAGTVADALVEGGSQAQQLLRRLDKVEAKKLAVRGGLVDADEIKAAQELAGYLDTAAQARADAAESARVERDMTRQTAGVLAKTYRGSSYAPGGSTYQSQVPYTSGGRG
jgi:hypothetical protein